MSDVSKTTRIQVRPPSTNLKVLVLGDGATARALSTALTNAGAPPERWSRRAGGGPIPQADVVVLAVRDEAISMVAEEVMEGIAAEETPPVLLHCAGAVPSSELTARTRRRPLGVGVLHPLKALANTAADAQLAGVIFAVEGDEPGRAAAHALVEQLGGVVLALDGAALAQYHAAAVLVANHTVGLVDAAVELLAGVGLPRAHATAALSALLSSAAENLSTVGLPEALTGPMARGDAEAVGRHLEALRAFPEIDVLYRATGRRVVQVAAAKGRATHDAIARIRALLDEG